MLGELCRDSQPAFLQLSTEAKPDLLVVRHLRDRISEEDELVVWFARILARLRGSDDGHCSRAESE